jgi:hypothetical protein
MNEQIKKLYKEATGKDWAYDFDPQVAEKFAELIVRECINKIETHEIPVGNSAAGEIACEMTYTALKQIRDEIKEQFGVK